MSIEGGRHYIIKAKEDTHKVFNLLKKGRNHKFESRPIGEQKFTYQIDDTFSLECMWSKYRDSVIFNLTMKDDLCSGYDLYEWVEDFYYDEKSNLHIKTILHNCHADVIGKWLESQYIYYYFDEWHGYGQYMTNDVGGEFFKPSLQMSSEYIESHKDLPKWFEEITGQYFEEFNEWSPNDQFEFCKKHSIPYKFNLDFERPNIKLPKHKIFEDTEKVIKKVKWIEENIKFVDELRGRDMSVFDEIDD